MRITSTRLGGTTVAYFDDLKFQKSTAGNTIFMLAPDDETLMELHTITLFVEGTVTEGQGQHGIPGSGFMGLTLVNGYQFRAINVQGIETMSLVKNLREVLRNPDITISTGGDATKMWVRLDINFKESPLYLNSRENARLEYVILDDFSGLETFTAHAGFKERVLEPDISRDVEIETPAQKF
jgi:hypothetical protein